MNEDWLIDGRKIPDEVMDYIRKIAVQAIRENGQSPEVALLPQLGLDFHKNKTLCVFNPLIFRTGLFRSAAKAPVVPT